MSRFAYETDDEDDPLDFCPMGCGGRTEDPYGGPCKKCWDAAPVGEPQW